MSALAAETRAWLASLAAPALAPFLADWGTDRCRPHEAVALPVLRHMPGAGLGPTAALAAAAADLHWRQSYAAREVGEAFLASYGWTELAASARMTCGVLLLGPHTLYPSHRHPAEEVYVPLAGDALWSRGDEGWVSRAPGAVIRHPSGVAHAMRTGDAALLALYLWRGDLTRAARLDGTATA